MFLFAMYIIDLEAELSKVNTGIDVLHVKMYALFYADDAVIFADSAQRLQNGINALYDYCHTWKLKLNTDKSQVMVFKRGRQSKSEKWFYGNQEIKVCSQTSYLGLKLCANGS